MKKNNELICPQCKKNKHLIVVTVEHSHGKFSTHSMCNDCYDDFLKLFGKGYPKMYRTTTMI